MDSGFFVRTRNPPSRAGFLAVEPTGRYNPEGMRAIPKVSNKRDALIETATRLFTENGFRTTGISEILTSARVAKGTLYQHFESKDALIEAVLRRMGEQFRTRFVEAVEQAADTPRGRLLAIFQIQERMVWAREGYCGCPFTRVAGEFADRDHPVHRVAALNKRLLVGYLRDLAAQAGVADPDPLAAQLTMLMEGAAVLHTLEPRCQDQGLTGMAEAAARTLVEAALAPAAV
jgi:AcrR family transcriptional regulator